MNARALIPLAAVSAALAASPDLAIQNSGATARLRGISAVNASVAWASGTGGTVLRTTDGGRQWTKVVVPSAQELDFRDIDAFDERLAYVLSIGNGESSRIYKTSDGGATWTLQLANKDPDVFLDSMAFWSPERGIAFSDSIKNGFVIFRMEDGQTWQRIPATALPPALEGEGAYAASGTNVAVHGRDQVWIGTTASRVLRSSDGGRTWTVAQTPIPTGSSSGIFSIAFRDERHGVVVGGDYRKEAEAVDNVAYTSDGGRTWALGKGLSGYRSAVTYVTGSKATWLAAGPQGIDVSEDDGRTWREAFKDRGFHAFGFAKDVRVGWGVGEKGLVARLEGF